MRLATVAACAMLTLTNTAAWSIANDDSQPADPTYREAARLIADQRFGDAVPLLKQVVARNPGQCRRVQLSRLRRA